ncbi:hypothetical protein Syn7502_03589 (plasmid) [Synechococcus sp. PCC 7502]|uniref:hypothetical protein n=1 Tax=Synechococcus sp. PCC 7502 TaxID=1173263 RepID=UPI00029FC722|nr:hypothetical protein [Synechococcus sp. PCC 7502]AFY75424.1 hypothetical protein Syn7502_03589 [Synechococcus sp. PCC 7502]
MNELKCFWVDPSEMPNLWEIIWNQLGILEGDTECLNNNEVWQYMGSKIEGSDYVHTFRHRCHPRTKATEYRHIKMAIG